MFANLTKSTAEVKLSIKIGIYKQIERFSSSTYPTTYPRGNNIYFSPYFTDITSYPTCMSGLLFLMDASAGAFFTQVVHFAVMYFTELHVLPQPFTS
jgi:hypothetical protein